MIRGSTVALAGPKIVCYLSLLVAIHGLRFAACGHAEQRRANRIICCLVCWTCGGRMGPNHFTLKDVGVVCGLCEAKNPLGNLRKMSLQEAKESSEIIVCFSRTGTIAHALYINCKTVLGPWIRFQSAETLEKALRYLQRETGRADDGKPTAGRTPQDADRALSQSQHQSGADPRATPSLRREDRRFLKTGSKIRSIELCLKTAKHPHLVSG